MRLNNRRTHNPLLPHQAIYLRTLSCLLALVLLVLTGCQTQLATVRPTLDEEGEIYLYLQPFSGESDRLSFTLERVSAIRDDGAEFPLELSLHELKGSELRRQRFLATGRLIPGSYRGLSLQVSKPHLATAEGSAALLTGKEETFLEFPFTVRCREAGLMTLTLPFDRAVYQGFSFKPNFTVVMPGRQVTGLTGYVTNSSTNTITVFDKQSRQVTGIIATGREPRGVVFDQQRKRAYVALAGEDALAVLDIATGTELHRIPLMHGDAPRELALTPNGRTLLTVNPGSNTVSIVDPLSFLETARVAVDAGPTSLLIDPAGARAYVFNSQATSISVVDIARRVVVATAPSEPGESRGAFNRSGDKLYVSHELSSYMTVLNPATLAVQQRLYAGMGLVAVKVDPQTELIYTGRKHDARFELHEPFSFSLLTTVAIGGAATHFAIDGETNTLFLVNSPGRRLQAVNLVTNRVEAELELVGESCQAAMMGER